MSDQQVPSDTSIDKTSNKRAASDASVDRIPEKQTSSDAAATKVDQDEYEQCDGRLHGWRFWLTMIGLYTSQFLVTLEMTVVTTALVAITNDLKDYKHATWVINAYFVTWSGFLVLWAQFSHTVGRKISFLVSLGGFVIWSAACAAAQTAVQLYIFRAFQGLTGAGAFSLPIMILSEAVPPSQMPRYSGIMAITAVVSFATGPLIGGAIANSTTWRWVFILDIPAGALAFGVTLLALPNAFPHQLKPKDERPRFRKASLKQLDWIGGILFLAFSILGVTAFEQVDVSDLWKSATIICLLIFSGLSAIAFVFWERYITKFRSDIMPVMTWEFCRRRTMAMFAASFLIGAPFIFALVEIPLRLQVIDGKSPLSSGVHLLPYIVMVPIGSAFSVVLGSKLQATPIYGQLIGATFQLIAVICFATVPLPNSPEAHLPATQYGFQVLLGFGSGFAYNTNFTGMFYAVGGRKELMAPAVGANSQFRYLGAAVGLGIATAVLNTSVRDQLQGFLDPGQISNVLVSSHLLSSLSPAVVSRIQQAFATAFVLQWKVMCGVVGLQIIAILLTY